MLVAVGFLSGTLQNANAFTFQLREVWRNIAAFFHDQARIRRVKLVGEGNFLLTFFGD